MKSGKRIVLVLPTATYRAEAFLEAAAELDAEVIVATEEAPPLASTMESRLVVVDLTDAEGSARRVAAAGDRTPIDAVVGVDDQGVLIAAHAGDLLDLPHNPPDAVAATRDKIDLRRILHDWRIPQPDFAVLEADGDPAAVVARIGPPVVMKPISLSASTGVIRIDTADDAVPTAERIRRILTAHERSVDEPILVERFEPGAEVSLEGLLRRGTLEVLALFDKPDPLDGPYFEETIYTTPSRLPLDQQDAVIGVAADACRAIGLREGPVHVEVRVRAGEDGPRVAVLDIAARSIGGLCARTLRFGAGLSLEEIILRHAADLPIHDLDRETAAAGVMMIPIPRSGRIESIDGTDRAAAVPGIVEVEMSAPVGTSIETLPEGGRYLGFVFARAETPEQVEEALRRAHAQLTITIVDPEPDPDPEEDHHRSALRIVSGESDGPVASEP